MNTVPDPELRALLVVLVRRYLATLRVDALMAGTGIPPGRLRPVARALDFLAVQP